MVIINSCRSIASRRNLASISRFSCNTSFLMRSKACHWLKPKLFVTHSRSSSSACAASRSFAQRSNATLFTSELPTPFFCNFFLAASVASKKFPISLDKLATVRPAASPVFSPARIVIGSIFTSHRYSLGVLLEILKCFLEFLP